MKTPSDFYCPPGQRKQTGYTLIEIMLVLGIIAILLGAAIYYMVGSVEGSKNQRVDADIASITAQLGMYELNSRFLPTTQQGLAALVKKPETEPVPRRWTQLFKEVPLDPWNRPYVYVYPGKHNPDRFDLYSLGKDGIESQDDLGNW